ncbi:hypothetical protein ACKKBF_B38770 [Auxenochlorella protothecoides x Auxenochlorella symbiontica]
MEASGPTVDDSHETLDLERIAKDSDPDPARQRQDEATPSCVDAIRFKSMLPTGPAAGRPDDSPDSAKSGDFRIEAVRMTSLPPCDGERAVAQGSRALGHGVAAKGDLDTTGAPPPNQKPKLAIEFSSVTTSTAPPVQEQNNASAANDWDAGIPAPLGQAPDFTEQPSPGPRPGSSGVPEGVVPGQHPPVDHAGKTAEGPSSGSAEGLRPPSEAPGASHDSAPLAAPVDAASQASAHPVAATAPGPAPKPAPRPARRSQHERLLAEARRLLGAPGLDGCPGDLDSITLPRHAADGAVDTEGGRLEVSRNGRVRARPLSWWAGERLMYASKAVGVQGVHAGSPCGDLVGSFTSALGGRARAGASPARKSGGRGAARGGGRGAGRGGRPHAAALDVESPASPEEGPVRRAAGAVAGGASPGSPPGAAVQRAALATDAGDGARMMQALERWPAQEAAQEAVCQAQTSPRAVAAKRRPGRPKGSKNKPKPDAKGGRGAAASTPRGAQGHGTGEAPGLAALAAASGAMAAAGGRGGLQERAVPAAPSTLPAAPGGLARPPSQIGTVQLDRPERCGTCIACTGGEESGECVTLQALRIMLGGGQQREAAAPAAVPAAKGRKRPAKATRGAGPKPAERSKRARAARPESSRSGSEEAAGGDGCSRPGAPPASTSCSPQAPGDEGPPPADEAWTREQVQALQAACLQVDPATTNFWSVVAAKVGRSAAECSQRWYDACPTPGTKRRPPAPAPRRPPRLGPSGAPSKAAMRRVVRLAQREARWEGEAAEASPGTLERVAERRAEQAARDKLIDQIFRKRGGQAWGGVLAQGLAGPRAREAGAAQLEAGDAQRAVRGLLAQEPAPALSDDSEEEVDYYWSDA